MEIHDQVFIHIQKFCQHLIGQLRGKDLQERYCSNGISHLKCFSIPEDKTGGSHIILCGKSCPQHGVVIKAEIHCLIRIKGLVQDLQPFRSIQSDCRYSQDLKIVQDIRLDTFQFWFSFPDIIRLNGKGNIF